MNRITIEIPKISDVDIMTRWGEENIELRGSETDTPYKRETLLEWARNPGMDIILVAKDGEKPVGMCMVHWMRDWAYCSELFVVAQYRKKGIGKMLLEEVGERLKGRNCNLVLVVEQSSHAKAFYEKQGFKEGFPLRWMDKKIQ
jgi:ribosomal protein S18 acetylase RimI-like enzyme